MRYGDLLDHAPSVLFLFAIAVACFACSKVGSSSSRNNRRDSEPSATRGELDRAVGQRDQIHAPSADGRGFASDDRRHHRRPEPRTPRHTS